MILFAHFLTSNTKHGTTSATISAGDDRQTDDQSLNKDSSIWSVSRTDGLSDGLSISSTLKYNVHTYDD